MREFLDVYRLVARNCFNDISNEEWTKEEQKKLNFYLDEVGKTIDNGDIIAGIWKRELETCKDNFTLSHIIDGVIEIEKRCNDEFLSQQKFAEKTIIPFSEINNEIEKTKIPDYVKSGIPPFKEVMYRYKNAAIYKRVYEHLLETLPDKFDFDNIYNVIKVFYMVKAKRELKHKTLVTYAGRYREILLMNKKIKVDRNSGMFVKVSRKEIIESSEKPDIAKPDDAWTAEDDEIIKKYYPTMTAPVIKQEKLPNRSEQAIYDRAYRFKIKKTKHSKSSKQEWHGLFSKDQILAKNATVYIYKPIVDEIMNDNNLPDKFTKKDLCNFLYNYFHDVLKKEISNPSANAYKCKYIKYLVDNNLVKEEKTPDGTMLIKIKKKDNEKSRINITIKSADDEEEKPVIKEETQPVRFSNGASLDEAIYNYAVNAGFKSSILTLTVERRFSNYTSDEIQMALAKLIQEGKAFQLAPGRIKFKIIDV